MLVLVGPSASGKTQILKLLIQKYNMKKLVTYTTRLMRINEVNGVDYYFISIDEFNEKQKDGFFFETIEYNGNYYGTSKNDFSQDKAVILEPNGLNKYLEYAKDQIVVVALICKPDILRTRMIFRGDSLEDIEKRIETDSDWFGVDLIKKADLIVDTSNSNINNDVDKIYEFYINALQGEIK